MQSRLIAKDYSSAKIYFEDWLREKYPLSVEVSLSDTELLEMFRTVSELVDTDLSAAQGDLIAKKMELGNQKRPNDKALAEAEDQFKKVRLALWSIYPAALKAALNCKGHEAKAAGELNTALTELARGAKASDKSDQPFTVRGIQRTEPNERLSVRAAIIAGLEERPDLKKDITRRGARLLGITQSQVKHIYENYQRGMFGEDLLQVVKVFCRDIQTGETYVLENILGVKC